MELTAEQKISILSSQRKVLAAQVAVRDAQKNLETVHTEYTNVVNKLAVDAQLDPAKHRLDLDNLVIVDISDTKPATEQYIAPPEAVEV
jgi:hypothetical protein